MYAEFTSLPHDAQKEAARTMAEAIVAFRATDPAGPDLMRHGPNFKRLKAWAIDTFGPAHWTGYKPEDDRIRGEILERFYAACRVVWDMDFVQPMRQPSAREITARARLNAPTPPQTRQTGVVIDLAKTPRMRVGALSA